jgi:queuine tRNA-ribosyltransferase
LRLVSLHNLHFYIGLMERAGREIEAGTFEEFRRRFVAGYKVKDEG